MVQVLVRYHTVQKSFVVKTLATASENRPSHVTQATPSRNPDLQPEVTPQRFSGKKNKSSLSRSLL